MFPRVVIIGAGFGGIAVAVRLLQAGVTDLTILESRDAIGGVWQENAYPGCACDIPASLYSFSFALNPDWSRRFPPRAEIQAYLEHVAGRFGVRPHLRLGIQVQRADYDEAGQAWQVTTASGEVVQCDVLVSAVGQLSRPNPPDIPGLETFAGRTLHSAQWTPGTGVTGRRVAVVGTGASAIQIVPAIAGLAQRVTVFQRSAPWTLPKADRKYGTLHHLAGRVCPPSMKLGRGATWILTSLMGTAVTGNRVTAGLLRRVADAQRRIQVRDPGLRRKVTPDYEMGCKRVLFTSQWFPALQQDCVELVTEPITAVVPSGVQTAGGVTYPADLLVLSTGFAATGLLAPLQVRGPAGLLSDAWRDGARAYLGITVPGFPNLFLVYGPNTNTGNTSVVFFHEAQASYITQAVRLLAAQRGGALDVRPEVEHAYDTEIQARLAQSVWTSCSSWYRAANGRVVTNWPGTAREYARRTARLDPTDYHVTAPAAATRARPGSGSHPEPSSR